MPSRKTVLNWSERANLAPNETVTLPSRSPLLDFPAMPTPVYARAPGASYATRRKTRRSSASKVKAGDWGKKRAARRRLRKLTGRRQKEWKATQIQKAG